MGSIAFRPTDPADEPRQRALGGVLRTALLYGDTTDADWEKYGPSWKEHELSFGAWDGDDAVGHASTYRFDTLLPGGAWVPTAGITRVGTLPTHRRQGILTELMGRLLDGARDLGHPMASLRASQATIYGRFGFGLAGTGVTLEIDPTAARPVAAGAAGSFRILRPTEVIDVVGGLYERGVHRVGAITRPRWLWERYLEEVVEVGPAHSVVVHCDEAGEPDGYAQYSVTWLEQHGTPGSGRGTVTEVRASSPAVERALWGYLLDIDLVDRWSMDECAPDDLLFGIVADPRAARITSRYDEQWVRILDVGAFLTARSFTAGAPPVRVAVDDPRFGDNCGTWSIGGDTCCRTTDAPELTTDIAGLSTVSLGAVSWWELVASGRAAELVPGAASRADALFAVRPLAFCGSSF